MNVRTLTFSAATLAALSLGGLGGIAAAAPASAPAEISPLTSAQCPTDMQSGEIDGCVTHLQNLLNTQDGAGLGVDGNFGPATVSAVETFQTNHGLSADGVVGPDTKGALEPSGGGGGGGSGAASTGSIAAANAGHTACGTNSAGGTGYASSCTGNGGQPEYWCADFAIWVWQQAGLNTGGLTAASGSFYTYGQNNGTLHTGAYTPQVGDVIVYHYQGGGVADHDGFVSAVNSDGSIVTQNGDFGGSGSTEAAFAGSSTVETVSIAASQTAVGSTPSGVGMVISAYVTPVA